MSRSRPRCPSPSADPIASCRERLSQGRAALEQHYLAGGHPAALLRGTARLVDRVLRHLWRSAGIDRRLALVAVGGYGRGELYPASDVDLLILLPAGAEEGPAPQLEAFIGMLWDIGLEIGHSVRTIEQCLEAAGRDITVQTALLEARFLCGARTLFERFQSAFAAQFDSLAFFRAKRLEQEERYAKYNDTPYALEPNCKEHPGGLRDLQIILWVGRAATGAIGWQALARQGLVSAIEARQLAGTENFLRRVRIGLHLIARRREDRLLFDHQGALAALLGCKATANRRAAEVLMQRYYRNAKRITQLNTLILLDLAARLERHPPAAAIPIDADFQIDQDLLDIRRDDLFERKPGALLTSFWLLSQRPELKGMTPRCLRALWHARHRIDAAFRHDPANCERFLALFKAQRGLTHQLRRMNQFDILGAYLPAFGRIVGRMQHDLFHVYTVDQHILQVVRNLRRLSLPEFAHEYPEHSSLMAGFPERWRLYLAALFHDIAKGRGGDHSKLGMRDARRFCRAHGLGKDDTALIVFLVEHHLTMSLFAQKRDLTDPETIRRFAAIVATEERLTALYLLTVCDIRGTGPKVWNPWKAKLLEDLYRLTRPLLTGERHTPTGVEERQAEARNRLRLRGLRPGIEDALWRELDTAYFLRHDGDEIAWHTQQLYHRLAPARPLVKARINPAGAGLQAMIYVQDQPELFARICGFFARLGFTIVDAKIHTTRHGYALDSFALLDPEHQMPYRDMLSFIEHELSDELTRLPPLAPPPRARLSRRARHMPLAPEVSIRSAEDGRHHLLSLVAADRTGLLYAIARVLARHGIAVHGAKIMTLGERVEDTFLISGAELGQTASLVQLEQELLDTLKI
ncbi:[protein-PII] uridylyltransferase [Sulfuricystis multivorans]|uniref:[protein-PII] uridylyltransferase n=1 Tax=Sulfuricystis multivorans TaxID=2211108 RepID=UPI0024DFA9FF|nr:[protein-PII] uridylyltransferase [Sulfuricystis multivorans]